MHDARPTTKLRRERAHLPPLTNAPRDLPPLTNAPRDLPPIEKVTRTAYEYRGCSHVPQRCYALSLPRVRFLERAAEGEV